MRHRLVAIHHVDHHGHAPGQMPHDVTMEQPHPWIVRAEPKDGVSASRDLHGIAQDGAAEIERAAAVRVLVRGHMVLQPRRRACGVPRVVGSPSVDGAICRQDVEVMAVLFDFPVRQPRFSFRLRNAYFGWKAQTHQMKRMRSIIQIIDHEIDPDRLRPGHQGELVLVPPVPRESDQRVRRIALHLPGCPVEETVWDVHQPRQFLDFGVHEVCLLGRGGHRGEHGAGGRELLDIDEVTMLHIG